MLKLLEPTQNALDCFLPSAPPRHCLGYAQQAGLFLLTQLTPSEFASVVGLTGQLTSLKSITVSQGNVEPAV
jgi:hypothetical protein